MQVAPGPAVRGADNARTPVQRDDDDDGGWLSSIGDAVSSVGSSISSGVSSAVDAGEGLVSDAGSAIASGAKSVAGGVSDVAGEAWQGAKSAAGDVADFGKDVYGQMKKDAGYVQQGVGLVGKGIDWAEDEAKSGTGWLADKAKGIPVLEQVADAGKSFVDTSVDVTGGALKGVTGMAGGILSAAADPVDTAKALYTMSEHVPGLGLPQKMLSGAYDLAFTDKSLGDVANQTLNPMEDAKYWGNVGKGLWSPLQQSINAGKPGEAVGQAGVQIAAMFTGAGEAGVAGEAAEGAEAAQAAEAAEAAEGAEAAEAADAASTAGEASEPVRAPVDPNVNPFGPTQAPPNPVGPTELPPDFLENPTTIPANPVPSIEPPPPGGFPELPPSPASPAASAPLRGMDIKTLGNPTGELAGLTDAEMDTFLGGMEGGGARSSSLFELPGQNPVTGGGLQDIREVINPNANQIPYNVNHYFSDAGSPRIADMSDVPMGGPPRPGESIIPEGVGTTADATPQTSLTQVPADTPVPNAAGEPIGNSNVEVRHHSANPRFPDQGPTVQVNTPSDRFGWTGDRSVAVEGEQGKYLLPDGSWKAIRDMTPEERAAAHWPTGN
jgi:hypothetical protein